MKAIKNILILFILAFSSCSISIPDEKEIHVWDTNELTLNAENDYDNPYLEVETWVFLTGPTKSGFEKKKVWGFWDGGNVFKVRVTATAPGTWNWESGSNQPDKGLNGKSGSFTAIGWTEAEKLENPNRRGTVRPTPNKRALMYADGTPFFLMGDTHWGSSTWRLPYEGKNIPSDYVIDKSNFNFEGVIQTLKKIGFNTITTIFSHPGWNYKDGRPPKVEDCKGFIIRQAKEKTGTNDSRVRGMHDEDGNMPFFFTGKSGCPEDLMPNYDSINPAYWKNLDKKFQYTQDNGFIWYAEAARRDHGQAWKAHFAWPESYARYLNYLQARYGTYNMIFALMHGDSDHSSISFSDWNKAFDYWHEYYGDLPFGQLQTVMTKNTLEELGHVTEHPWMQAHTTGNTRKDHRKAENLIDVWNAEPPVPGFCNEPYYVNFNSNVNKINGELPPPYSDRDYYYARAYAYACVLSGALPGHIYGTGARWSNSKEEEDDKDYPGAWETLKSDMFSQAIYMRDFILSIGEKYQNLVIAKNDLSSPKSGRTESFDGWSYMMRTPDKSLVFLYFENDAEENQTVSGLIAGEEYRAEWFDPRTGKWMDMTSDGFIKTNSSGSLTLPDFPATIDENNDWAARLMVKGFEDTAFKNKVVD